MSSYDSSSQGSEDNVSNDQYFRVFQHDFYLSGSLPLIQEWKQHGKLAICEQSKQVDPIKYMEAEQCIFDKQQNMLLAAYHIRYYAFAFYINKALKSLILQYQQAYKRQVFELKEIQRLDQVIIKISIYLQKIQLSRASSYIQEIDDKVISQVYGSLQLIFPLIVSPYCIWRIVMFLQIMHEDQNFYVMNIPVNMPLEYYLKTHKTLKFKHPTLTSISLSIHAQHEKGNYLGAFVQAFKQLCKHQSKKSQKPKQQFKEISDQLRCEYLTCLKYMHFVTSQSYNPQIDLYIEYITSSLKVPFYGKNQNMPCQYYEKLFLKVLQQFRKDPRLIDLGLYIDPNVIGQRSQQSFGKIQQVVLRLCQQLTSAQQEFLQDKTNPKLEYVQKLLKDSQFTLLIQFLQTIMEFNKSAFLKADNQVYEIFLDMADFLKNVFLSFGKDVWLFPMNVFTPLTLAFFKKIAEDINDDLKNILYEMVQNLNQNKLPQKLVFQNGQFKMVDVTRLQYLCAIMYYIEDCSREQEYLNLPEIAPTNMETSLLLIKSLHVKLKHHEPNPTQLPLFIEYLKECEKYKLTINFSWYKLESLLTKSSEREMEFQIQSSLPIKQISQIYRKCLNYRDRQYARKLIMEDYNANHLVNPTQLAAMLKYNHGIQKLPEIVNIREEQIFFLLEQMQTMLAILPDNLFDLPLDQEINVSYLHILLTFYCSKIKEAKGSQIYLMILQKVLINYLKSPFSNSKRFKAKYPKFFQQFIYQYHQIEICATFNELLMDFQQKCLPFSKKQEQWSPQQKVAVQDLKQKIQIIRDEFLDKLEGSQEEIGMFMVTFTSLISESLPFKIFLQCVRLFVKLINKKPSLGQIVSLNIFISELTYQQPNFLANMLSYFQSQQTSNITQKVQVKRYLLRHIINSPEILDVISFRQLMELIGQVDEILAVTAQHDDLANLYAFMKKIANQNPEKIRPEWILPYLLLFYRQKEQKYSSQFSLFIQEQQQKERQRCAIQQLQRVLAEIKTFQQNSFFWESLREILKNFKFKEFDFLFIFIDEIKQSSRNKKQTICFSDVWMYFLRKLNDPSWTFYHMLKLNDPTLIDIHEDRDAVLINLIKRQKLTKQSYPIFKMMISQTKNFYEMLNKIMQGYEQQQNYVQNYQFHNKLILINERFPDPKIQQCILKWIQRGENKLPLKIPQHYYTNFIKKQLKLLPENLALQTIFKVHESPQKLTKINKQTERLFQILLYFPVKSFQSISLSNLIEEKTKPLKQQKTQKSQQKSQGQLQIQDQGEWEEQDQQNQDVEITKTEGGLQKTDKDNQQSASQEQQNQNGNQDYHNADNDSQHQQDYDDSLRPDILQIFYEDEKKQQLEGYKQVCQLRQQIDIYLKSDYEKLKNSPIADNGYIHEKLLQLLKELKNLDEPIQKSILIYLPQPLHYSLKQLGYTLERDAKKIQKLRKSRVQKFRFRQEIFSDRAQSDNSDQANQDEQDDGYSSEDDEGDGYSEEEQQNNDQQEGENAHSKKVSKKQKIEQEDDDFELPELSSKFTKVQSEIKGTELDRPELIKILQIFLIQLFKLTPTNFKKKEVVYSYVQIMESDLSQIFFESVLTVLRMDQNHKKNRKVILQQIKIGLIKSKSNLKIQQLSGLSQFSKYNGLVNFCHLLKSLKQKDKYPHDQKNPFRKESGTILPIAQKCIIEFDLPLQTNVFSLVLLYIHSKPKIRELLQQITVPYDQEGVTLTQKQIKRIGEAFLNEKTHSSVWEYIQSTINYKVKDTDRLKISLDSYSKQVFRALSSSGIRVKQTIQKNNQIFKTKAQLSQKQQKPNSLTHIKHFQRLYYITSNLLSSCSQQIKQFYFMNKNICRYLWQDDDENDDNYNFNKVPKKLIKIKQEIYTNQSFVLLLELAIRIIYYVKKELYGKISSKKFARLIHYPKMIIQTATLYMIISGPKGTKDNWNFKAKNMVEKFIENYQMGQYQFKDMVQVYNLVLGLIEIESFCTAKFKEIWIPHFVKNKEIGLEAPLMFKVPAINEDFEGQNIFVTRQCSFDMSFYQVNGGGLYVQFHGQQGSDHGGMIRQLMMGWKGTGVGQQDFFIGKILGISFGQSVPYGGHVDLQMCIKITNYKLTLENMEQIDKDIYSALKFIKQNDPSDLCLTFSVMKKNPKNFEVEQFDLKLNGSKIQVTQQNKEEYIQLYLEKYYQVGREHELEQISTGFYSVVSQGYASIFKPHELLQHLKGKEVCDINVLKAHVKYMEGYTQTSVIIKWLWQILETYNQEQLNKFIQFLTGSPKLPIFNPNFEITIQKVFQVKNLPVAHTCFNTLDLPEYPSKDILVKNLLTAIFEGNDNFGIM